MNITLSAKDADFILKYLRADLERVCDCSNKIKEKQTDFKNKIQELEPQDCGPEMILVNGLLDISNDMIEESNGIKNDLMKCIELLTVGSELNGAA